MVGTAHFVTAPLRSLCALPTVQAQGMDKLPHLSLHSLNTTKSLQGSL